MTMKKTALVTGASRGIGRAAAELLARNGWRVVVNYNRSKASAYSLVTELTMDGFDAIAVRADVSDRAQVEAMVQEANSRFGGVDLLVNNAGIARQRLFTEISPEEWNHLFDVNVTGMFHCCQCVLPQMIRRHSGKIINISSVWGMTGASCEVAYSASKAAVIGLTRALAKEVGPSSIQVNCIAPGVIDTEMNETLDANTLDALKEETPLGVLGTPQDIAHAVLFLASDQSDFITGQVLSPNGGFLI
ncbi:MAG: SDR family oxidoreductase [Clostridiales bacterium]|nr:SDR family oxidoreductase [Clostridiales bacterium]